MDGNVKLVLWSTIDNNDQEIITFSTNPEYFSNVVAYNNTLYLLTKKGKVILYDYSEVLDNDCKKNCSGNGYCHLVKSTEMCVCKPNYTGINCQTTLSICSSSSCVPNNTISCENLNETLRCVCQTSYYGKNCEFYNFCVKSPCIYGLCDTTPDTYFCNCFHGYRGRNCDIKVDCDVLPHVEKLARKWALPAICFQSDGNGYFIFAGFGRMYIIQGKIMTVITRKNYIEHRITCFDLLSKSMFSGIVFAQARVVVVGSCNAMHKEQTTVLYIRTLAGETISTRVMSRHYSCISDFTALQEYVYFIGTKSETNKVTNILHKQLILLKINKSHKIQTVKKLETLRKHEIIYSLRLYTMCSTQNDVLLQYYYDNSKLSTTANDTNRCVGNNKVLINLPDTLHCLACKRQMLLYCPGSTKCFLLSRLWESKMLTFFSYRLLLTVIYKHSSKPVFLYSDTNSLYILFKHSDYLHVFNWAYTKTSNTCLSLTSTDGEQFECTNKDQLPCESSPCRGNTTVKCINIFHSYKCKCKSGHFGKHCEAVSECKGNTCKNGGKCVRSAGLLCICTHYYTGDRCQFKTLIGREIAYYNDTKLRYIAVFNPTVLYMQFNLVVMAQKFRLKIVYHYNLQNYRILKSISLCGLVTNIHYSTILKYFIIFIKSSQHGVFVIYPQNLSVMASKMFNIILKRYTSYHLISILENDVNFYILSQQTFGRLYCLFAADKRLLTVGIIFCKKVPKSHVMIGLGAFNDFLWITISQQRFLAKQNVHWAAGCVMHNLYIVYIILYIVLFSVNQYATIYCKVS